MQITGRLYGAKLLNFVQFPAAEVLGPDANYRQLVDALFAAGVTPEHGHADRAVAGPGGQLKRGRQR